MASLEGTQTEKNLMLSFAGESQAHNRYNYFASVAKKEGFEQISAVFADTADNEKEHAKVFFKYLEGGECEITGAFPAGVIGDTLTNLKAAAAGELMEWGTLYPDFARIAKEEGFTEIANSFLQIAEAEKEHEKRFNTLAERVEKDEVFKRCEAIRWRCRNCGRVMSGAEAPELCPACKHPQAHFEPLAENY